MTRRDWWIFAWIMSLIVLSLVISYLWWKL
jgi:hypothetical protein